MTAQIIEALAWGTASGIVGATYRGIIADEETFNFWWKFGARFEGKWFFKPVWGCAHCFAGQFTLWTWLILKALPFLLRAIEGTGAGAWFYILATLAGLFRLIIAISTAILVAKVFSYFLNRMQ